MNKFILLISFIIVFGVFVAGQSNDMPGPEKRTEDVVKSFMQLEKQFNQLKREQNQFENNMEEQLSQFNIVSEQNNVLLNRQIEQLSNLLGHDVALVREHVAKQESLQQRTQKRHKIHFIIVYSMLFLSLMGLVFVYVYYAKLLRDYDLFQNKRINEVRNEHRLALESIRTDVTTRIDASVDEMMGEFLKIRQETDAFQQAIRNRVDDVEQQTQQKIDELHETSKNVTKEQQEQLRLIIGNAAMKKDIQEVSDKLNSFRQTMQTDLAVLKNTNIEMNRDINKKFLQLKTTVQKTGVKKTKDNI